MKCILGCGKQRDVTRLPRNGYGCVTFAMVLLSCTRESATCSEEVGDKWQRHLVPKS